MGKPITALAGFLILGLSPSFVDWQDNPDRRKQIILYYGIALLLLYYGLFSP